MKLFLMVTFFFLFSSLTLITGCKAKTIKINSNNNEVTMCTMEVKLCPDGSYVSRTGSNCEFTLCSLEKKGAEDARLIEAAIIGSAESPDPILERVLKLEKEGLVSNVVVMESFPVQIHLRTTQQIIDELKSMPRVISPSFR